MNVAQLLKGRRRRRTTAAGFEAHTRELAEGHIETHPQELLTR